MRRLVGIVLAGAVLAPGLAAAQVQPHRAEYALRLGIAANAPRIGTAVHDLSLDCSGWHLKRDIKTEIALTASWKMSLASKLDGQEPKSGNGFRYSKTPNSIAFLRKSAPLPPSKKDSPSTTWPFISILASSISFVPASPSKLFPPLSLPMA